MTLAPAALADAAPNSARRADWAPSLAALLFFAFALFAPAILNDGDTFWHIAAGDWILAHRAIPTADPFTFSHAGAPWTAHEWLSEVFFALSYRLGGWDGVMILAAAAAAATAHVLVGRLGRDLHGPALAIVATLGLCLLPRSLLARPHLLALPVLAAWAAGLFAARDSGRAPSLALLPLMTLWANLHGSFVFGLALLAPLALEALIEAPSKAGFAERRIEAARDWILFGLLAAGAALINPRGAEALIFPFKLMGMNSLAAVSEWRPESFARVGPMEIALLALIGFALHRPIRVAPLRLALLIGLIHLALRHSRHDLVLGLVGPMILARPIAQGLGEAALAPLRPSRAQGAALAALFIALAGIRLAVPLERRDTATAPVSALAAVPASLRGAPVLNHYDFGGYLIFSGVRPYVDGRTDMFGDAFLADYDRIVAGDSTALDAALDKWSVAWTIFPPGAPVVRALELASRLGQALPGRPCGDPRPPRLFRARPAQMIRIPHESCGIRIPLARKSARD